jgi:predicted alpha/beta-hydrolase family hydrolase
MPEALSVELPSGAKTSAVAYTASASAAPFLVLAHGAGADQRHRFLVDAAEGLAARGVDVITFNFLYTEAKRRAPDRNDALEACWSGVLAWALRRARGPVFLGGKSMGGRIASQIAAKDAPNVAGLVFLGYPLHPPAAPERLRDKHLPDVKAPMLFVQGTRDAFGTPEELSPIVVRCHPGTRVLVIEGGDHSFAVPKSAPVTSAQVFRAVVDDVAAWIHDVSSRVARHTR